MPADYIVKEGDTYPPMLFTLVEATTAIDTKRYPNPKYVAGGTQPQWIRRIDFSTNAPDSAKMIAKLASPSTTFQGPMDNVEVVDGAGDEGLVANEEPGLGVPTNRGQWRYPFSDGDTDQVGTGYQMEYEITWDEGASPPAIQRIPNETINNPTLDINPQLGA